MGSGGRSGHLSEVPQQLLVALLNRLQELDEISLAAKVLEHFAILHFLPELAVGLFDRGDGRELLDVGHCLIHDPLNFVSRARNRTTETSPRPRDNSPDPVEGCPDRGTNLRLQRGQPVIHLVPHELQLIIECVASFTILLSR